MATRCLCGDVLSVEAVFYRLPLLVDACYPDKKLLNTQRRRLDDIGPTVADRTRCVTQQPEMTDDLYGPTVDRWVRRKTISDDDDMLHWSESTSGLRSSTRYAIVHHRIVTVFNGWYLNGWPPRKTTSLWFDVVVIDNRHLHIIMLQFETSKELDKTLNKTQHFSRMMCIFILQKFGWHGFLVKVWSK